MFLKSLKEGFRCSLKSWKGVLIIWAVSFVLITLVRIPFSGAINSGFGSSMLTERLIDGIEMETIADLGTDRLLEIGFSLVKSLGFVWLVSFLANIFFTGGIFGFLWDKSDKFVVSKFLETSVNNFSQFFVIKVLSGALISLSFGLTYLFLALFNLSGGVGGKIICAVLLLCFLFLFIQMLLVSDFAGAARFAKPGISGTKALGVGFRTAFSNIVPSTLVMLTLTVILMGYSMLTFYGILYLFPKSGFSVFLLFVAGQLVYSLKVFIKIWRYGSVTSLLKKLQDRRVKATEEDIAENRQPLPDEYGPSFSEDVTLDDPAKQMVQRDSRLLDNGGLS